MNKRQRGLIFLAVSVALLFGSQYSFAGTKWDADFRLTEDLGYAYTSTDRSIATGPEKMVHAVWNNDLAGSLGIYYNRSEDGGETWGEAVDLTENGRRINSWNQAIAADDYGGVHVVWQDSGDGNFAIYYKGSLDEGENWGNDVRLTESGAVSWLPSIATGSPNTVHVAWQEEHGNTMEVYYRGSSDGGATWGDPVSLTVNNYYVPLVGVYPAVSIAANSQNMVYVAWCDSRDGNYEIYVKSSKDGGKIWGADTRVTFNDTQSQDPSIAIDSNNRLHLAWQDYRYGFRGISYKRSMDEGQTWGSSVWLTQSGLNSVDPSIAVDPQDRAHVVWYDYVIEGREIYYKIYYRRSSPAGRSWEEDDVLLVDESSTTLYPSIAADSESNVHLVWTDDRDQNGEIYYKQGTQETPWKIFGPVHR